MHSMRHWDEGELVAGLRAGDTAAFDAAYDAYRPRLFGFLLRLSRRRSVAEDLLDETWLRLVAHAASLRPDTRLGAWLFTVARNLYWSYRRASALEEDAAWMATSSQSQIPATTPSPFELAAGAELQARVERALGALSPQHREVLLLVVSEGLPPSEAATVCGISAEALRQRLSRARTALASELDLDRPARRYGT
jgi:RNA polymerase sigma factor (sigma-70 family)